MLSEVLDKVVQHDYDTEGILYWSVMEAAQRHVAAPTIAAGQYLRAASGNRAQHRATPSRQLPPQNCGHTSLAFSNQPTRFTMKHLVLDG